MSSYPTLKPGDTIRCANNFDMENIKHALEAEGFTTGVDKKDGKWIVIVKGYRSGPKSKLN